MLLVKPWFITSEPPIAFNKWFDDWDDSVGYTNERNVNTITEGTIDVDTPVVDNVFWNWNEI